MHAPGFAFPPPAPVAIPIENSDDLFPVNRVFCVGRNYAAHVREMGFDPDRDPPCYFTKSPSSVTQSGSTIAYPPGTENFHHEIELVIAVGKAGFQVSPADAGALIYGFA